MNAVSLNIHASFQHVDNFDQNFEKYFVKKKSV